MPAVGSTLVAMPYSDARTAVVMPSDFKAKRHGLRAIPNPYTSKEAKMQREKLDALEGEWLGTEVRRGQADRKEMVYQRDQGICGICGNFAPWEEATLDHITPRHRFKPPESGDTWDNLWIV